MWKWMIQRGFGQRRRGRRGLMRLRGFLGIKGEIGGLSVSSEHILVCSP